MKTYKAVLAALVVISSASAARADLTQQGAVGLPLNPTAQLPPENTWRLQANYSDIGDADIPFPGVEGSIRSYGLVGAGRIGNRLEINGGINRVDARDNIGGISDPLDKTGFAIGAKYLFTRESDPVGVRIAAGVGYDRSYAKNLYAYVVGTKSFGRGISEGRAPITGHLGLRWDKYDLDYAFAGLEDSSKASIYGGIEVPFTRSGDWSFVGELQSKNDDYEEFIGLGEAKAPYSASIRYRPAGKGFSASLGWQRRNFPVFVHDSGFFAQIGYTFGEGEGIENESDAAVTTTTTTVTP